MGKITHIFFTLSALIIHFSAYSASPSPRAPLPGTPDWQGLPVSPSTRSAAPASGRSRFSDAGSSLEAVVGAESKRKAEAERGLPIQEREKLADAERAMSRNYTKGQFDAAYIEHKSKSRIQPQAQAYAMPAAASPSSSSPNPAACQTFMTSPNRRPSRGYFWSLLFGCNCKCC